MEESTDVNIVRGYAWTYVVIIDKSEQLADELRRHQFGKSGCVDCRLSKCIDASDGKAIAPFGNGNRGYRSIQAVSVIRMGVPGIGLTLALNRLGLTGPWNPQCTAPFGK